MLIGLLGKYNKMAEIANDTLKIVKKESYTSPSGRIVELPKVDKGEYITVSYLRLLRELMDKEFQVYDNTEINVINEGTVDAVFRLKDREKVGILNFASAHHAGGGFKQGAIAQEECLAYCSNLYDTLEGNQFYDTHAEIFSKTYTDNMIFGNVTFFKDSKYSLVEEPKTVKVVTSAAVNMRQAINSGEDVVLAKQIMKERMRKILLLMAKENCETVVLGAFGCGVFGNNPVDVATNWKELLIDEGMQKYFKEIVFSIYDKPNVEGNFKVFQEILDIKK